LRFRFAPAALLVLSLFLTGCKTPPVPPEAAQADTLEHELWRAGALIFTPDQYNDYKALLRQAKNHFIKEKARFIWFRNYRDVQKEFQGVLSKGNGLYQAILALKSDRTRALTTELNGLRDRLEGLHQTTQTLNEGRLARTSLTRAEIAMSEARILLDKGQFEGAAGKIAEAEDFFRAGQETILSLLTRYFDPRQVKAWKTDAEATIAESRARGTTVFVVAKLERELAVYRGAKRLAAYGIGLGRFGLSDKVSAGDDATPEGRYRVTKKFPWTKFYKALMINYPNDEDRKKFARARKMSLLPASASIGGLIEIHGGGRDGVTEGCVAVDNEVMDTLYSLAEIGTAVTIVGTLKSEEEILKSLNLALPHDK